MPSLLVPVIVLQIVSGHVSVTCAGFRNWWKGLELMMLNRVATSTAPTHISAGDLFSPFLGTDLVMCLKQKRTEKERYSFIYNVKN
jgi:hypothetical protein